MTTLKVQTRTILVLILNGRIRRGSRSSGKISNDEQRKWVVCGVQINHEIILERHPSPWHRNCFLNCLVQFRANSYETPNWQLRRATRRHRRTLPLALKDVASYFILVSGFAIQLAGDDLLINFSSRSHCQICHYILATSFASQPLCPIELCCVQKLYKMFVSSFSFTSLSDCNYSSSPSYTWCFNG